MKFALIRDSDNAWLAGPLDEAPEPGNDERVIEVALGYPDTVLWSPALGGFVDVVVPTTNLTPLQFQRRFTIEERIAIRASVNPVIQDYRELAQLAGDISLVDDDVVAGVNYLESQGLIGPGRAAQILTP